MKQLILSFAILFFLASCQDKGSDNQKQTSEDHITSELSENIENETIFLGLQYGMSGEEVRSYFRNLVSQGKLQLVPHEYLSDEGKIYVYNFDFEDDYLENVTATFKTYYIQNKLYKLRISVDSENGSSLQPLKSKLKEVYVSKYGENYIVRENIYNNSEGYLWIEDNHSIEISEGLNNNLLIIYTDLIAVKESEEKPQEALMREI